MSELYILIKLIPDIVLKSSARLTLLTSETTFKQSKMNIKYYSHSVVLPERSGLNQEGRKEGRKCLFNDALNTFYFTVIWRQTYGKGPLR